MRILQVMLGVLTNVLGARNVAPVWFILFNSNIKPTMQASGTKKEVAYHPSSRAGPLTWAKFSLWDFRHSLRLFANTMG